MYFFFTGSAQDRPSRTPRTKGDKCLERIDTTPGARSILTLHRPSEGVTALHTIVGTSCSPFEPAAVPDLAGVLLRLPLIRILWRPKTLAHSLCTYTKKCIENRKQPWGPAYAASQYITEPKRVPVQPGTLGGGRTVTGAWSKTRKTTACVQQ